MTRRAALRYSDRPQPIYVWQQRIAEGIACAVIGFGLIWLVIGVPR